MDSVIRAIPPAPTCVRGFTLTEMAVALLIVALLIGGMLLPLSAQRDIHAQQETRRTLAEVRDALVGFAVVHGRLPRPAVSATDGSERGPCANDADCHGFIPWAALGVQKSDHWGKLIRYSVTRDFANNNITVTAIADRTVRSRGMQRGTCSIWWGNRRAVPQFNAPRRSFFRMARSAGARPITERHCPMDPSRTPMRTAITPAPSISSAALQLPAQP